MFPADSWVSAPLAIRFAGGVAGHGPPAQPLPTVGRRLRHFAQPPTTRQREFFTTLWSIMVMQSTLNATVTPRIGTAA